MEFITDKELEQSTNPKEDLFGLSDLSQEFEKIDQSVLSESFLEQFRATPLANPGRVAAIVNMFGFEAPSSTISKILFLNAGVGANVVAYATQNPQATVVMTEPNADKLSYAKRLADQLKLSNIEFINKDINELPNDLKGFNYIFAIAFFSRMTKEQQHHFLQSLKDRLAPKGLALVSYNTYPGWKMKEVMRDAMLFRAQSQSDPKAKLAHGRGMINFMAEMSFQGSILRSYLESELPVLRTMDQPVIAQEYLSPNNLPVYFTDFIHAAQAGGLAYVSDFQISMMLPISYGQAIKNALASECGDDQIKIEQYLDFLSNRTYRVSILTRQEDYPKPQYEVLEDGLITAYYGGIFMPTLPFDEFDTLPVKYQCISGREYTVRNPIQKAALATIHEAFPNLLTFREILESAQQKLGKKAPNHRELVLEVIGNLVKSDLLLISQVPVRSIASKVAEKPKLAPFTQAQLVFFGEQFRDCQFINILFESTYLNPVQLEMLPKLDGEHTLAELEQWIISKVKEGVIRFQSQNGQMIQDDDQIAVEAKKHVMVSLENLRQLGHLE